MGKNERIKILIWHMADEMVKKQGRTKFCLPCNYFCTLFFSENVISYVKEPSHFSMLESKLSHNKTETKNIKVAKMMEIIKTCDQYPYKFNFGYFSAP